MSIKKVFIGTRNVASQLQDWQRGFEQLGLEVMAAAPGLPETENSTDLSNKFSWTFRGLRPTSLQFSLSHGKLGYRHQMLKKGLEEYDLFVFIWNSIYDDYRDLEVLRKAGKKIVFLFVGNDVRWYHSSKQEYDAYGIEPIQKEITESEHWERELNGRLRRVRMAEKYADLIITLPNCYQLSLRPYHQAHAVVDPEIITHNPIQREKPLVIHAPSNNATKGSRYIMPVLEKLSAEMDFDIKYVQNMPYKEALKTYSEADILVGQALIPSGGKQEREALAAGTVVLSSMCYDYPDKMPLDCPIVDINPRTVEAQLRTIVPDWERRKKLAIQGRPFVDKYHAPKVVTQRILDLLENPEPCDFYPTFFKDDFVPESDTAAKLYNKWNQFVSDCSWYGEHITRGERDGLVF